MNPETTTVAKANNRQARAEKLVQEMAAHLGIAGFEAVNWLTAYDWEQPIDADTWHILAVARRGKD